MEKVNLYKKRDNALREKFNDIAEEYEEYRFTYPEKLFDDIICYSGEGRKALEIGIGTGKATPFFLKNGYKVVAVEPVKNMLEVAKRKFSDESIEFIHSTFEELEAVDQYDLIYAASSFQWVNGGNRLGKVYTMLRKGGVFARFKTVNIILPEKNTNNTILIEAYKRFLPDYLPMDVSNTNMRYEEYESKGFSDLKRNEYYIDHELEIEKYVKLVNTYTEYLVLDVSLRKEFEDYIIGKMAGEKVAITQKCTLYLARKH
ncbi:Methyltransferase domain-containing protein [Pseudobutyrivibrio sp. ACV-2]|uniref:class I SAM-dependent DNA methyltransferase n=1 Tax=Pseudobutyrivibrio sp. ACV-2 TaxID=1520801 RepID=UPI000894F7EF|nr:class I SAM-dependent methyltransferase [Pseudobutyrivibrio sp. ACV-2]SEA97114.1 Methyltransferase domain-containing protein [Pseudobutyrivibrio sp. ACV-2]